MLHRAAYRALGLSARYEAIELGPERLPGFLADCGADWLGLSLTMPLKQAVLPLLDEIHPLALTVHAANTVVLTGGRRVGHNTDVEGIVTALREVGVLKVERPVVLGSGATARSALAALQQLGATRVRLVARSPAPETEAVAERLGLQMQWWPLGPDAATGADLVVSTLPAGVADEYAGMAAQAPVLLDVVYAPWPTALARACRGTLVPGSSMLLHQAAAQVRLMTGRDAPVQAMRHALEAALGC